MIQIYKVKGFFILCTLYTYGYIFPFLYLSVYLLVFIHVCIYTDPLFFVYTISGGFI